MPKIEVHIANVKKVFTRRHYFITNEKIIELSQPVGGYLLSLRNEYFQYFKYSGTSFLKLGFEKPDIEQKVCTSTK